MPVSDKQGKNAIFILTGGHTNRELLQYYWSCYPESRILCVDGGLKTAYEESIMPDYIVGDFDTIESEILDIYINNANIEIKKFNPVKDNTDTDIGLKLAISKQPDIIFMFGATGTRMDHTLGNLHILYKSLQAGIETYIIDAYNKIYMIDKNRTLYKERLHGSYISFIPFTQVVKGVFLEGFKYCLNGTDMYMGDSLGISNEVIEDKAYVYFKEGVFLVIEARDTVWSCPD